MNCIEAQALVSAAHDGEPISDTELAAARAHCATCEECTAFVAGMKYLDVLPVPPAPEGLTARVMEAVAPLATERAELRLIEAERAEADSVGTESPDPASEPEPEPAPAVEPATYFPAAAPGGRLVWFTGPIRWATLGAATALAATALVAFVVVGLGHGGTPQRTVAAGAESTATLDLTYGGASQKSGSAPAVPQTAAPAQAPDYVLYKDFVYSPGALLADANTATPTIGTLSTAFASGGAPQQVTVYKSPLTDGSVVVKGPDGLRLYSPVIRMLTSVRYQLTSGKAIDHFGVWPVLPARFPVPTDAAGTPSFVTAGTDALGVGVFSATGRPVTEGFAIAPGTATSDPAGGNPNWTWWAPAPANQ